MPASGEPVATAKPAPAPPVITYLSQAGLFLDGAVHMAPSEVPMSTAGPSLPRGTPAKKLIILPIKVPIIVRSHLKERMPLSTPSLRGMPPPFDSGMIWCSTTITDASAISTANVRAMYNGDAFAAE